MRRTITTFDPKVPLVQQEGEPTSTFNYWIKQVTDRGLLIGTGSPEGVVEAQQGVEYMDEAGAAGFVLYIKQESDDAGDRTKGWVAIG
jgi:hypothetical protein